MTMTQIMTQWKYTLAQKCQMWGAAYFLKMKTTEWLFNADCTILYLAQCKYSWVFKKCTEFSPGNQMDKKAHITTESV